MSFKTKTFKFTPSTNSEKIKAIVKSIECLKYSALDSPSQEHAVDWFAQEEIMYSVLMNMANLYLTLLKSMTIEELNESVDAADKYFEWKFAMDEDTRLTLVRKERLTY